MRICSRISNRAAELLSLPQHGEDRRKKSGRPWSVLAAWATAGPEHFIVCRIRVRTIQYANGGESADDDATMKAVIDYFRAFTPQEKP